jgi:hypothetical protein
MVSFTPLPLYLRGKNPQSPLGRKLDGEAVKKIKIFCYIGTLTSVLLPSSLSQHRLSYHEVSPSNSIFRLSLH